MNLYHNPETLEVFAGITPADALAAARQAERDFTDVTPAELEPITPRELLTRTFNDLGENEQIQAWNAYTEATHDPDARIEYYGSAADYADEINDGDAAGALDTLDKLYKYGAPYYGEFIKWGVYIEVGGVDDLITSYHIADFVAWAEGEPVGLPREFQQVLDDISEAREEAEEYEKSR